MTPTPQAAKELIEAQKKYIEFLGNDIRKNATFLHVHGLTTSEEDIKKGKELRQKIKILESQLEQDSQAPKPTTSDPHGALNQQTMSLDAERGDRITVTARTIKNGYSGDQQKAEKYLKIGKIYIVQDLEVHEFSSAVILKEFPTVSFNTVNFIDA